mgnify:CR=1 FL=1
MKVYELDSHLISVAPLQLASRHHNAQPYHIMRARERVRKTQMSSGDDWV